MKASKLPYYQSDWVKAGDLPRPVEVAIERVTLESVYNPASNTEDEMLVLFFKGKRKGLILSKTRCRQMIEIAGDETEGWPGLVIQLTPAKYRGRDTIHIESPAARPPAAARPGSTEEPPDDPDVGSGKMAAPVQQLFDRVQAATGDYYKNAPHLCNAVGGWPDFNDPAAIDAKFSTAVDHVKRKDAPADEVEFAMKLAAPGGQ